jgi:hypothetical protein
MTNADKRDIFVTGTKMVVYYFRDGYKYSRQVHRYGSGFLVGPKIGTQVWVRVFGGSKNRYPYPYPDQKPTQNPQVLVYQCNTLGGGGDGGGGGGVGDTSPPSHICAREVVVVVKVMVVGPHPQGMWSLRWWCMVPVVCL